MNNSSEQLNDRVQRGPDGKYRWIGEMNLLTSATIFLLVWKIFFFIILGMFLIFTLVNIGDSDFWWSGFLGQLKVFGLILAGMTGLTFVGYLVYAAIMGGKYIVQFEMDEQGINHAQIPKQAKKAQKIAGATFLGGAAAGSLTTMGVGLTSARTSMYSDFAHVKKVKCYPNKGLIKVNQTLTHNQVYCRKEDFEFVSKFIIEHCPKVKKAG